MVTREVVYFRLFHSFYHRTGFSIKGTVLLIIPGRQHLRFIRRFRRSGRSSSLKVCRTDSGDQENADCRKCG